MSLDVYLFDPARPEEPVYWRNITHNLGEMASQAGVYYAVWRPEEHGYRIAADIVELLRRGIVELTSNPDYYREFNPINGWGSFDTLVEFLKGYHGACMENPEALISVSR